MKPTPTPLPETRTSSAARVGAAAWLIGAAQFLIVQLIASAAWHTPFSWAENNISDLGNVHCQTWDASRPRYVCSPLHDAMNISFAVHGILLLIGIVATRRFWGRGRLSACARVLLALDAAGWVLVGFVPADVDENLHVLGALLIMGLGNLGLICTGFLPTHSRFAAGGLRLVSVSIAAAATLAAWLFFSRHDPGIGFGTLERIAAFAAGAWTLVMVMALATHTSPNSPR
ncbi:hypothetical protein ADL22_23755 [Streptomyces sp. NRRL F-4489]|uniref:DUF998 domain-containing protein n=1 Tax=Streptomyces sp. NRRL F-4489 TaxID=1609095 RepID=UPI0007491D4A|nr:DUF998 domain-containing protein [Streptomyces sp. NRRL F-4489]KUL36904.1 hypothetical protein ADL22_23755 [Streptomyces sp. NRRL F-4489]